MLSEMAMDIDQVKNTTAVIPPSLVDMALEIDTVKHATIAIPSTLADMTLEIKKIKPFMHETGQQISEQLRQGEVVSRHATGRIEDSITSLSWRFEQTVLDIQEIITATGSSHFESLRTEFAESRTTITSTDALAAIRRGIQRDMSDIVKREVDRLEATILKELGRLIAKPSRLREVCDIAEGKPGSSSQPLRRHSPAILARTSCICRKRRTRSKKAKIWGSWQVLTDTMTSNDHHADCICYIPGSETSSRRWAVAFTGLVGLLNRAIEVSFSYSSGAGGFSIGPDFTSYPTVDGRRSPVFRICSVMNFAAEVYGHPSWKGADSMSDPIGFLELCTQKLILLYRHGKASPKAVDMYGRGVMHYLFAGASVSIHHRLFFAAHPPSSSILTRHRTWNVYSSKVAQAVSLAY